MFSSKKIFMAGKKTRTVTISQQPASQTASNGTATFNVVAEVDDGSPPRYQWQKQPGNVATWEQYQLPTSNTWGKTLYNNGRFATIASMDKPAIMLSRRDACWRWGKGEKTPWYPSMTIFRRERAGDWDAALGRAAKRLPWRATRPANP
jgi:hypothetical protein